MKLSLLPRQHLEPVAQQVALEPRGASGVVVVVDEPVVGGFAAWIAKVEHDVVVFLHCVVAVVHLARGHGLMDEA